MIGDKCFVLRYQKSNDTSMFKNSSLSKTCQMEIWAEQNFGNCVVRAESLQSAHQIFNDWVVNGLAEGQFTMCSLGEITQNVELIGSDTCDLYCVTYYGIGRSTTAGISLIRANNVEDATKKWEENKASNTYVLTINKIDVVLPLYERKVALFDDFAFACPFFTNDFDVNNGYGCTHPEQDETDEDKEGIERGKCYCWSCPLGVEADEEDLDNSKVDWDGLCSEREVSESEYIMVRLGQNASADEKSALRSYERRTQRYNLEWPGHKGEESVYGRTC